MKATGIVRRIDELGRIVVPKEIRRVLHIKEGDPIEIFAGGEGEIVLKKYSPIGELEEFASDLVDSMALVTGQIACIVDRDSYVAVSGGKKKELEGKTISKILEEIMEERVLCHIEEEIPLTKKEDESLSNGIVVPILCHGDCVGAVMIWKKDGAVTEDAVLEDVTKLTANFLVRQLEL